VLGAKKVMNRNFIRLWKVSSDTTFEALEEFCKDNDTKLNGKVKADFPGKNLTEADDLDEAEVAPDDIIFAEIKSSAVDWRFNHVEPKRVAAVSCSYCRKPIKSV
jgi:hypothetical protein